MVQYFLCDVVGSGKTGDAWRPSLIQSRKEKQIVEGVVRRPRYRKVQLVEIFKYPYKQWSVIYYPEVRPYELCLCRIELVEGVVPETSDYVREIVTNSDWAEIAKYGFSKEKWQ